MIKHTSPSSYPVQYFEMYKEMLRLIGTGEGASFRLWMNYLIRVSKEIIDKQNLPDDQKENALNVFRGDMLEVFSELFFNSFYVDETCGIKDYTPVAINEDYGVDAIGTNVNGHKCAVQVKFRANPADLIEYADIARTFCAGLLAHDLKDIYAHNHTIFVFTSATGVTAACQKVLGKKVVLVNRLMISKKVDNNLTFWEGCYKEILEKLGGKLEAMGIDVQ